MNINDLKRLIGDRQTEHGTVTPMYIPNEKEIIGTPANVWDKINNPLGEKVIFDDEGGKIGGSLPITKTPIIKHPPLEIKQENIKTKSTIVEPPKEKEVSSPAKPVDKILAPVKKIDSRLNAKNIVIVIAIITGIYFLYKTWK